MLRRSHRRSAGIGWPTTLRSSAAAAPPELIAAREPAYSRADLTVQTTADYAIETTAEKVIEALATRPDVLDYV